MKERIQKMFGSLRAASVKTKINYYRVSQIVNGWIKPSQEEMEKLKITKKELDEVKKYD